MASTSVERAARDYKGCNTKLNTEIESGISEQKKRGEEMQNAHKENLAQIGKDGDAKLTEFETTCSGALSEFETKIKDEHEKLVASQKEEHSAHLEKLHKETDPKSPRWSHEYFRLRRVEDMLYKQKRYLEADEYHNRADALEKVEQGLWAENRDAKIKALEKPLLTKHKLAVAAHERRSEKSRGELLNKHKAERKTIERHYAKLKAQAEEQHQFAMLKHAHFPGTKLQFANSLVLKTGEKARPWAAAQ